MGMHHPITYNKPSPATILLIASILPDETSESKSKFPLVAIMASIYSTFILEEPIHPVGSEFPGNLKVTEENNTFYCPVKDNQKDNPNAICHLCLAEQTPNI